jgi:hypothetical protein
MKKWLRRLDDLGGYTIYISMELGIQHLGFSIEV